MHKVAARGRNYDRKPKQLPFWLPALSFYFLNTVTALIFFFLAWGILQEGSEEAAWIPAGLGAGFVFFIGVILREVVLRKKRQQFLLAQKRLDFNLKNVGLAAAGLRTPTKLTLSQNAMIIDQIKRKSEAAQVLNRLSDGHWEVFEICNEYLLRVKEELKTVGAGSPRLAALRLGGETVGRLHRYHLLTWAEIESRSLTQKAKNQEKFSDKIETARLGLSILETALRYYPNERQLTESTAAVRQFISSMKISNMIRLAEQAAVKGSKKKSISLYREVLSNLNGEDINESEAKLLAQTINAEIEKLSNNRKEIIIEK